jgi:misacylated tRNA(Ala) deacylase
MTAWLFRDFPYQRDCEARVLTADARGLVLDCTIFYPHGGGQPGDTGKLERADGTSLPVIDTLKGETRGEIVHVLPPGAAAPRAGETIRLALDWDRRYAHMRMHTACHLLSAALPYPVTGGSIRRDSARLDFDMPASAGSRDEIAAKVNALIEADHPVFGEWMEEEAFLAREDLVRTLAVAPPRGGGRVRLVRVQDVDVQACGGTHVAGTREIGPIVVTKIENKGKQNRRVTIAFAETAGDSR